MRLRKRQQFQRMAKSTLKWTGEWILVTLRPVQHPSKLGIVVTKRFGSSPQRNRFKRIVREAFRLAYPEFTTSFEILVRPRSKALEASMQNIQKELKLFVDKSF
jgi:ribonuclease P protein component